MISNSKKLNIDVKSKNYINKSRKIGIDDYYNDTELIDIIKEVYKNENKFFNFNEVH